MPAIPAAPRPRPLRLDVGRHNGAVSDASRTTRDERVAGRVRESARVEGWLATVPDGACALLIRGEPGIGKTTLWRHAVRRWRAAGHAVFVTRPAEEELPLALCGLTDLLEEVVPDPSALSAQDNPVAQGRLVLDAIRTVAAARPLVIAIDDLQWLDAASARALRYALRRLDTEPVGVLGTVRTGRAAHDPLEVASLLPPGRVETMDVGPMDPASLRQALGGIVTTISPEAAGSPGRPSRGSARRRRRRPRPSLRPSSRRSPTRTRSCRRSRRP